MPAVVLAAYSPDWPAAFRAVRAELLSVFAADTICVEHVGSTAVVGLPAKPVIDVLLGAPSLADIEARIGALVAVGYVYRAAYEQVIPDRRYFVRPAGASLRVHLHGVVQHAHLWREHLAFRDALRRDPSLQQAYQTLKQRLAVQHADDKAAYTAAKAPFIRRVLGDGGPGRQ
jgi:GrpB-like predicted nucleotidyltransferase (UPF0157 family)